MYLSVRIGVERRSLRTGIHHRSRSGLVATIWSGRHLSVVVTESRRSVSVSRTATTTLATAADCLHARISTAETLNNAKEEGENNQGSQDNPYDGRISGSVSPWWSPSELCTHLQYDCCIQLCQLEKVVGADSASPMMSRRTRSI